MCSESNSGVIDTPGCYSVAAHATNLQHRHHGELLPPQIGLLYALLNLECRYTSILQLVTLSQLKAYIQCSSCRSCGPHRVAVTARRMPHTEAHLTSKQATCGVYYTCRVTRHGHYRASPHSVWLYLNSSSDSTITHMSNLAKSQISVLLAVLTQTLLPTKSSGLASRLQQQQWVGHQGTDKLVAHELLQKCS